MVLLLLCCGLRYPWGEQWYWFFIYSIAYQCFQMLVRYVDIQPFPYPIVLVYFPMVYSKIANNYTELSQV